MKINIVVDNDKCWNLNTVRRLIIHLKKKNISIDNIWVLPNKLSNFTDNQISFWYLRIFGFLVFFKLVLFYILVIINNFLIKIKNFNALGLKYNLKIKYLNSINDKIFLDHLKNKEKKIFLLITNHILKKKIFFQKKNIFINKHSSLLPSYKGLMPYIWTKIYNDKNGITFHLVTNKIDSGRILYQNKINKKFKSMVEFYIYIFQQFPQGLVKAINNLEKKKYKKNIYKKSYYSIPTKRDFRKFKKNGGNIILFLDLFKISKIVG